MRIELGRFLHDCRTKQGLALEVIAESTRITLSYLRAIEEGEFERPSASRIFVKAYLKSYSRCLRLEDSRLELRINEAAEELPDSPRAPRTIVEQGTPPARPMNRLRRLFMLLLPRAGKQPRKAVSADSLSRESPLDVRA